MSQEIHWKDRAITASEVISDGFEVLKAYGARVAEWILFFCLIANIIEIFPLPSAFAGIFGNIVLGVQSVTLDVAGFGLTTMGSHARNRGDVSAARKASAMGWTLILLMVVTVTLVTLPHLVPPTQAFVDIADKALILVRVVATVFYGHIVHSLRSAGTEHENQVTTLEDQVSSLKKQLDAKEQEVSSVHVNLSTGQQKVSSLQAQLDTEKRRAQMELNTLSGQLDIKQKEIEALHVQLSSGQGWQASRVSSLQQEIESAQAASASLRRELYAAKSELERVQQALASEQQTVSSLRKELSSVQSQGVQLDSKKVSTGQREKAGSGHLRPSTGQQNIVQLDTRRRSGQDDVEEQIRALHKRTPVQSLSARAIASSVGCSPTTASRWKLAIEEEEKAAAVAANQ